MDNNREYGKFRTARGRIARHRDRPEANRFEGTALRQPDVDFAGLARSLGMDAFGPVEHNRDLAPTLAAAVRIVEEQHRPVLVDVVTGSASDGR